MLKYQTINYADLIREMREDDCSMAEVGFFISLTFHPAPHSCKFKWSNAKIKAAYGVSDSAYIWRLKKSLLEKGYLVDLGEGEYKIDRVTFFSGNAPQEDEEDLTVIEPTRKTYVPKEKPEVKPKEEPKPAEPKLSGKEEFNQMLIDMGLGNTSLIQK